MSPRAPEPGARLSRATRVVVHPSPLAHLPGTPFPQRCPQTVDRVAGRGSAVDAGDIPGREESRETHLSAQQPQTSQEPRVPPPHVESRRARDPAVAPSQGTAPSVRVKP